MIIAYPLKDIISLGKTKRIYQKKGIPTKVIVFQDNMAILENTKGIKFPTNKSNLIWCETGP